MSHGIGSVNRSVLHTTTAARLCAFSFACGLVATGCAPMAEHLNIQDPTMQATTVGGVMGAGLGAIIGSQTGSAGVGLVLGSVAGSGAGYAIGEALEERNQELRSQEELLERQEQRIAASKRELATLQGGADPSGNYHRGGPAKSNTSSATVAPRASSNQYDFPVYSRESVGRNSRDDLNSPYYDRATLRRHQLSASGENSDERKKNGVRARDGHILGSQVGAVSGRSESFGIVRRVPPVATTTKQIARAAEPVDLGDVEHESMGASAVSDQVPVVTSKTNTGFGTTAVIGESELSKKTLSERALVHETLDGRALEERSLTGSEIEHNAATAQDLGKDGEQLAVESAVRPAAPITGQVGAITSGILATRDDDCIIASQEIAAAQKTAAPADKLFHQRKALRLCPNQADYHVELAATYQALSRKSDALYEIREALKLDATNQRALALQKEIQ